MCHSLCVIVPWLIVNELVWVKVYDSKTIKVQSHIRPYPLNRLLFWENNIAKTVKFLMRNFGEQNKGRIWVSVPKTLKNETGAKISFFRVIKFRRIFDLFLIRFRVLFCERVTFPGFTVIFGSIHLKVLECIFLGGFVFFYLYLWTV